MATNLLGTRLKRYKGLVALISSLILFIIIVVVIRTYMDTVLVQRETFARAMTLNYVDMIDRFGTEDAELRDDINQFVLMFRDGGRLATPFGPAWDYPAIQTPALIEKIDPVIEAYSQSDWRAFEAAYIDFDAAYGEQTQGRQKLLIRAQYVVAGIIFLGFLGVLGLLFFRLGKADDEAAEVRRENDHILASTKEGVFLIDSNYQIGEQRSKAVSGLFGQGREVDGNFLDFIAQFVTDEDLARTEKFLNIVFGGRVKPKLMGDLNPLHNVELQVNKRVGGSVLRVLNFDFSRDEQSEGVDELLVTVSDITAEAVLRDELEAIQSVQEQRLNLLKGVLHVEPAQLSEFFTKGREAYTKINAHLEEDNADPDANFQKLDQIARITHRLKGDAGALRLDLFSSSLHQFEDTIDSLRKYNSVDGQSLVKLVVQLKNMIAELELASSLTNQFGMNSLSVQPVESDKVEEGVASLNDAENSDAFTHKLTNLTAAVADRESKQVNFSVNGAHHLEEKPSLKDKVYDIAVQLVRNAVVHGIEVPAQRAANDKPEFGKLEVSFVQNANELSLTVTDDGQGLQFERIKEKAVEIGFLSPEMAQRADQRLLLKALFVHGFSSKDEVTEDAGRGVGLDAVREMVDELKGRISVATANGKHTRFVITLPTQTGQQEV
jgi:signal transduction histidine kinase